MTKSKQILAAVVCAGLLAPALPAPHANAAMLPQISSHAGDSVALVGYRGRGYGRRHRHGGGWGAAGVVGAIIAGTIIAAAISEGRASRSDLRRCDEDFYDFDYRTGTYIDRRGRERVCPYLR